MLRLAAINESDNSDCDTAVLRQEFLEEYVEELVVKRPDMGMLFIQAKAKQKVDSLFKRHIKWKSKD